MRAVAPRSLALPWLLFALANCGGAPAGPLPAACSDGLEDGDETAVDCGGATCGPCPDHVRCLAARDCASGRCVDGFCGGPFCDDGKRNGGETDVDCGGPVCLRCDNGRGCAADRDCVGNLCRLGNCAPSCPDGKLDGNESDVDCGGLECAGCEPGQACRRDGDCARGRCVQMSCVAPPAIAFDDPMWFDTGLGTGELHTGDLDGDGYPDLAYATLADGMPQIGALLSRFPSSALYGPTWSPAASSSIEHHLAAFVDLNADGRADALAALQQGPGDWLLERMLGDGVRFDSPLYATDAGAPVIAVGDLSGDGLPDVVAATGHDVSWFESDGGSRLVFRGFIASRQSALPSRVALGDLDGDGKLDCAVAFDDGSIGAYSNPLAASTTATVIATATPGAGPPDALTLADLDGDNQLDYLWTSAADGALHVARGAPHLGALVARATAASAPRTIAIADFNGDQHLDVVLGGDLRVTVLGGNGDGTFEPAVELVAGNAPRDIASADFDLDGRPDLTAGDFDAGRIWLFMNQTKVR